MMHRQARACMNLSGLTLLPVQLVVLSLPAGTSLAMWHVASPQNQPVGSASPNRPAVVVRRMKEAAHTNGTSEPTPIKVEYQCALALKCAAGLSFPPLTIMVTLPVISHAVSVNGLGQKTKVADYWSVDVTNVVASH